MQAKYLPKLITLYISVLAKNVGLKILKSNNKIKLTSDAFDSVGRVVYFFVF